MSLRPIDLPVSGRCANNEPRGAMSNAVGRNDAELRERPGMHPETVYADLLDGCANEWHPPAERLGECCE